MENAGGSTATSNFNPNNPTANPADYQTSVSVSDATGMPRTLTTYFVKTAAPDAWSVYHQLDNTTPAESGGIATFNATTGALTALPNTQIDFGNGFVIDLEFTGIAQQAVGGSPTSGSASPSVMDFRNITLYQNTGGTAPTFNPSNPVAGGFEHSTTLTGFLDSSGNPHNVTSYFVKTAIADTWQVYHQVDSAGPAQAGSVLTFTGNNLNAPPGATTPINDPIIFSLAGGATLTIDPDFGDAATGIKQGAASSGNAFATTTALSFDGELDKDATPPSNPFVLADNPPNTNTYNFSIASTVNAGVGNTAIALNSYFVKTSTANQWHVYHQLATGDAQDGGLVNFNPTTGAYASGGTPVTFPNAIDATTDLMISPNFSGLTEVTAYGGNPVATGTPFAFDPDDSSTYSDATSQTFVDSQGGSHNLTTYFVKTSNPNEWDVYHRLDTNLPTSNGTITFDPSTGAVVTPPPQTALTFSATDLGNPSADPFTLNLDFSNTMVGATPVDNTNINPVVFDPADSSTYSYATAPQTFVDSQGGSHNLTTYFVKTNTPNQWSVYHQLDANTPIANGTATFDPSTGAVVTPPPQTALTFSATDLGNPSADPFTLNLDFSNTKVGATPVDTTAIGSVGFNPDELSTYAWTTSSTVYDSKGIDHNLQSYFVKTSNPNEWEVHYKLDNLADTKNGGLIKFSSNGAWVSGPASSVSFLGTELGTGAANLSIAIDFSKTTQESMDFKVMEITVDGKDTDRFISSQLGNLWVDNKTMQPRRTSEAGIGINISARETIFTSDPDTIIPSDPSSYNYSTSMTVYDSRGVDQTMNIFLRRTSNSEWSVYTQFRGISTSAEKVGTLTFDARGILSSAADPNGIVDPQEPMKLKIIGIDFGNGSGRQNIKLDFADTTQFDSASVINSLTQNGYTMGNISGVEVDELGQVVASYSNNQTQVMGQVALARFANTQGLKRVGDNNWVSSNESGSENVSNPGVGSMGKVIAGALEGSNVELTTELVDMITAQRNFQANAQVINTTGTLYQAILNVR